MTAEVLSIRKCIQLNFDKKGFRLIAKGRKNMFRTMEEQSQSTALTSKYSLNMAAKILFFIEPINSFNELN